MVVRASVRRNRDDDDALDRLPVGRTEINRRPSTQEKRRGVFEAGDARMGNRDAETERRRSGLFAAPQRAKYGPGVDAMHASNGRGGKLEHMSSVAKGGVKNDFLGCEPRDEPLRRRGAVTGRVRLAAAGGIENHVRIRLA